MRDREAGCSADIADIGGLALAPRRPGLDLGLVVVVVRAQLMPAVIDAGAVPTLLRRRRVVVADLARLRRGPAAPEAADGEETRRALEQGADVGVLEQGAVCGQAGGDDARGRLEL